MSPKEHSGNGHDLSLEISLKELQKSQVISREEEIKLAKRVERGDQRAKDKLVDSNRRFSYFVALKYKGTAHSLGIPFKDIWGAADLGLVRAVDKYDYRRRVRFISYAVWWVRQAVLQEMADQSRVTSVSYNDNVKEAEISRTRSSLEQELGREASRKELSEYTGVSEKKIERMESAKMGAIDLYSHYDGDGKSLVERLGSNEPGPDDITQYTITLETIEEYLNMLTDRQAIVIRSYFGLFGEKKKTLEEIGKMMGFTRERARQIKEQGIGRLRIISKLKRGRKFVGYAEEF